MARLRSTARLDRIQLSENLLAEARVTAGIEVLDEPHEWAFDPEGDHPP